MPPTPDSPYFEYVDELIDSRLGSPYKAGGKRDYTRKWLVKCRDNTLGANIVCLAPGVAPYAPYATEDGKEWDYQALCMDLRLERPVDPMDGFHKIVVAEYSTEMPQGGPARFTTLGMDPNGDQANPQFEPPHLEWEGDSVREAPPYDLDGKAYLNSARQPYKPAPGFETGRAILVYARNEISHDARKQIRYSYAVNSDIFLGEEPGTVQLMPPRATLSWRGPKSFWRVTYRFRFNSPDPIVLTNKLVDTTGASTAPRSATASDPFKTKLRSWQPKILDAGLMQLQSGTPFNPFSTTVSGGLPVPIFRAGAPVTEPVLLNGTGRQQKLKDAKGQLIPVWNDYRQFLAIPFTPILVSGYGLPF